MKLTDRQVEALRAWVQADIHLNNLLYELAMFGEQTRVVVRAFGLDHLVTMEKVKLSDGQSRVIATRHSVQVA